MTPPQSGCGRTLPTHQPHTATSCHPDPAAKRRPTRQVLLQRRPDSALVPVSPETATRSPGLEQNSATSWNTTGSNIRLYRYAIFVIVLDTNDFRSRVMCRY